MPDRPLSRVIADQTPTEAEPVAETPHYTTREKVLMSLAVLVLIVTTGLTAVGIGSAGQWLWKVLR